MKFWIIFKTEIKHVFRSKQSTFMMMLFPLILMLILGTALSREFNDTDTLKNIDVLYLNSEHTQLASAFQIFVKMGAKMGIKFQEIESRSQGIASIRNSKFACFILISSRGLELYKNERYVFQANLMEAVLQTFMQRFQVISLIAKVNPQMVPKLLQNETNNNLVMEKSLNRNRQPRAMDYYAVTMLTLIIMYASITSSFIIKRDILMKTANRLLCCPVKNHILLIAKTCGAFVATFLQVLVVILVSKYGFLAYWGTHPGMVIVLLISEIVMAVSIGIGLAFLIRNQIALTGFLNILIPVIVFFGGGYFSIDSAGPLLLRLAQLSPLRWINQAIFQVIYSNDFRLVVPAALINLGVAAIFIMVASLATRKEAFLT